MEASLSERTDRIFRALSDDTRRRIWQMLGARPGASTSDLTAAFPRLSRWAVMKHLAVLREAELVQTMPLGRQRRHYRMERSLDVVRIWLEEAD
jgi:DNA-binding transcriptional ArsR family regulator